MNKTKYEVGDYVRIKPSVSELNGCVEPMDVYGNQLARIVDIGCDEDGDWYHIDIDDGDWYWYEDCFEYRLGNYENNKIENHSFKYMIGYKTNEDSIRIKRFNGFIENFAPNGKSAFIDDNGKMLVLPWKLIEYIIPLEGENEV